MQGSNKDQQAAEQGQDVKVEENDPVAYAEVISTDGWKNILRDIFSIKAIRSFRKKILLLCKTTIQTASS